MSGLPEAVSRQEALELLDVEGADFFDLLARAGRVGFMRRKNRIRFCAIINARSGGCGERCAFCAQSVHHDAQVRTYPMMKTDEIVAAGRRAAEAGATRFSIVTSGGRLSDSDVDRTARALEALEKALPGVHRCASLGDISLKSLSILKSAGLERYHHNLETSRRFHDNIVPTRSYCAKIDVIRAAASIGLEVCSGGITGMGETKQDIVDLGCEIANLGVDALPLNYLDPRPGTPLASRKPMTPFDALRATAVMRLVSPVTELIICGGRNRALGPYQPMLLFCGIDGMMVGDYLTTKGANVLDDKQFIEQLKFEIDI